MTTFITAEQAHKRFGVSDDLLSDLEIAGHYFPPEPRKGVRTPGVPLFRTADVEAVAEVVQAAS